jgi:regulator of protease activity HflC (stomatin/prohibitin superfamily)
MQKAGIGAGAVLILTIVGIGILFLLAPFTVVDTTERAVITNFGTVDRVLGDGFHFVNPFTEDVHTFKVSAQKVEVAATAASKDLQDVTTTVAVQYKLDETRVGELYSEYQRGVQTTVIDPAIQDAIKAGTASYTAEQLITQRPLVKEAIEVALKERLAEAFVIVTNVDIVNFNFSESFNSAIEAKVTAEQEAQKAKNDLARVEFEAQQRIEQAKAEAEAIRIQAEAVTSQGGADYVELQRIERWNGQGCTSYCGIDTSTGLLINR